MRIIALALFALLLACPVAPVCEQLQTRCADAVAQVCDADGRWQDVMNCAEVEGDSTFSCQEEPEEGHTCLPVPEEGEE